MNRPVYPIRPVGWLGVATAVALLALAGCRPLYLPAVPEPVPVTPVARLGDASRLTLDQGVPTLHLVLGRIPEAGWLAVQWFAPDGAQVASDSVWVAPADEGQGRTLALPPSARPPSDGEWRAVVSLHGRILRQFRVTVSVAQAAPGGDGSAGP